jgi:photosynthetic reaction center cytochrome c subunit
VANRRQTSIAAFSIAVVFVLVVYGLPTSLSGQGGAQPAPAAQQPPPGAGPGQPGGRGGQRPCAPGETVGQHYSNIKVIKELPCPELQLAMQSIAASLGVGCDHCHVTGPGGAFDRDDKEPKDTARTMMKMVEEINTRAFEGRSVVACATCHHGQTPPQRTTPLAIEMTPQQAAVAARRRQQGRGQGMPGGPVGPPPQAMGDAARGAMPPAGGTPAAGRGPGATTPPEEPKPTQTVDQVLNKYVQAIGGRDALQKIQSRIMTGTVTMRDLQQFPVTVEEKLPNSYRFEIQSQPQPQTWAASGTTVWGGRGGGGRGLQGFQAQQATRRADLGAPLNMTERYQGLAVNRYATIDDRNTIVLVGRTPGDATEQLHFDRETGLLLRRSISTRTPFSPVAEQIDYSDYRDVSGVKMPFTVRYANWNEVQVEKFTDIKVNAPIDDSRFAMPAQQPQRGRGAF